MYQIGEFSYLCEVTIKTLRYYDKINLLKPVKIDNFTGYRYYDESQIPVLQKIKGLQLAGFSLKEIKDLLNNEDKIKLTEQIKKIEKESSKKIEILQKIKKSMKNKDVELIANPNFIMTGIFATIKSRKDISKVLQKIDKIVKDNNFKNYDFCFENYEKGYQEDNIKCFIGRVLPERVAKNINQLIKYKKKKLIVLDSNKVRTVLHATVKDNILDTYKTIVEFANKNSIQIRGSFQEIHHENKIDIYVEAYDLTQENEDEIRHRKDLEKRIKNIHPEEYIGKWELVGEIIEPPYLFNPKKKHYNLGIKYNYLELYSDGSTNLENVTWKDSYLIFKEDGVTFYSYLHKPYRKGLTTYMDILISHKETNARPYKYYYKKIK